MTQLVLKQYAPVQFSRIYALGAARGDLTVTNDDIAGPIDSSDEWIRQRTGIITRRRASADRSLMDMAVEASNEAIASAGIDPSEIGAVLFSTITHPHQTPSAAALLADKIGANPAPAFDISAACTRIAALNSRETLQTAGIEIMTVTPMITSLLGNYKNAASKHFFEAMGAEGVFEAFGRGNLR